MATEYNINNIIINKINGINNIINNNINNIDNINNNNINNNNININNIINANNINNINNINMNINNMLYSVYVRLSRSRNREALKPRCRLPGAAGGRPRPCAPKMTAAGIGACARQLLKFWPD